MLMWKAKKYAKSAMLIFLIKMRMKMHVLIILIVLVTLFNPKTADSMCVALVRNLEK